MRKGAAVVIAFILVSVCEKTEIVRVNKKDVQSMIRLFIKNILENFYLG
jgi:hypothetical protein